MKLLVLFFINLFIFNFSYASISCEFVLDKIYEIRKDKFIKPKKIYDSERIIKIKIDEIEPAVKYEQNEWGYYKGVLNSSTLVDRKVDIKETPKILEISQSQAYDEYFTHYSIFKKFKNKDGSLVSSMYHSYPGNWGYGTVSLYKGFCDVNVKSFF